MQTEILKLNHERSIKIILEINAIECQIADFEARYKHEESKPYTEAFLLASPQWYKDQIEASKERIKELQ